MFWINHTMIHSDCLATLTEVKTQKKSNQLRLSIEL